MYGISITCSSASCFPPLFSLPTRPPSPLPSTLPSCTLRLRLRLRSSSSSRAHPASLLLLLLLRSITSVYHQCWLRLQLFQLLGVAGVLVSLFHSSLTSLLASQRSSSSPSTSARLRCVLISITGYPSLIVVLSPLASIMIDTPVCLLRCCFDILRSTSFRLGFRGNEGHCDGRCMRGEVGERRAKGGGAMLPPCALVIVVVIRGGRSPTRGRVEMGGGCRSAAAAVTQSCDKGRGRGGHPFDHVGFVSVISISIVGHVDIDIPIVSRLSTLDSVLL
ncbi:hypothetical protein GALMADRAFT_452769 [Galerina marginata CBS 339.88]|uniref:Uncharacterized protein n=1 Tax=Galerina marginata (strain CBS 339.88) TaxID=685588 RepID=A0A067TCC4_GALM3|nr:hypothetical protein GALMADRAFT_452769 [Galerina marginata CBS 339.88]